MTLFVYILASKPQGTLYVGVTNDLVRRVAEHKEGLIPGFTKRYGVKKLVYWEAFDDYNAAIAREKKLKRWRRDWKRALIEENNPHWADLFGQIAPARWVPDRPLRAVRDDTGISIDYPSLQRQKLRKPCAGRTILEGWRLGRSTPTPIR